MKKNKVLSMVSIVVLLAGIFYPLVVTKAVAASLTDITVTLANEATSGVGNVTITFTPSTAITDGSILEINYDSDFGQSPAQLTDGDIAVTGTNITSSTESDFADGYFKSTLTCGGSVTTTVTILIDGTNELQNPGTEGNYAFSVTADIGGAGSTFDYGAGLAYIADDNDVTVTATVPPTIDMEIYEQNSGTKTNACALGVLSLSVVKTCIYDVAGATNNAAGMTIKVTSDGDLDDGTSEIDAVTDGAVTAGAEEYGFQITDDGSSDQWDGGTYETGDRTVPTTETTFASTTATIDAINVQADRLEVTHSAAMATNTPVSSYDQLVTYTAYTN